MRGSLFERVLNEKRRIVLPLVVLLVANVGVFALGVYPQRQRELGAEARAKKATADLQTAVEQEQQARAAVTGRARAVDELKRFYAEVLPKDQVAARRLTYLRLAEMAQDAGLRVERRSAEIEADKKSELVRLDMTMVIKGGYREMRRFIYDLETAHDFVVISDVTLSQGQQADAPLELTMLVSTYYRAVDGE